MAAAHPSPHTGRTLDSVVLMYTHVHMHAGTDLDIDLTTYENKI